VPAAVLAAVLALTGCGSTRLLRHTSSSSATTAARTAAQQTLSTTTSTGPSAAAYVEQLRAAEQMLAAAERRIPTNARTPGALAHSATLLAAAVSRLARGLAAIEPPPSVAGGHADLVAVARAYAMRLRAAAVVARAPGGQVRAGALLISATNRASAAFRATLSKIYSTLGVPQP
jgi:hypothetical protein